LAILLIRTIFLTFSQKNKRFYKIHNDFVPSKAIHFLVRALEVLIHLGKNILQISNFHILHYSFGMQKFKKVKFHCILVAD